MTRIPGVLQGHCPGRTISLTISYPDVTPGIHSVAAKLFQAVTGKIHRPTFANTSQIQFYASRQKNGGGFFIQDNLAHLGGRVGRPKRIARQIREIAPLFVELRIEGERGMAELSAVFTEIHKCGAKVGATAGLYMITYFVSNAMAQVGSTIMPPNSGNWQDIINNSLIAIGTICGLVYFFFSKEHKGVFGGAARIGTFVLMLTFGASFGYTVMSRMSLMLGRFDFLFGAWLGLIK